MRLRLTSALAAAGVTGVVAVLSAGAGAVYGSVAVFPAAGTPVASPNTQISFRGASPAELSGVKVRGSKSGSHSGKLRAHSDGLGASFLPDHPFHAGERVTVKAGVSLIGAKNGVVTFTIARPPGHYTIGFPGDSTRDAPGIQHFHSRPDIAPPSILIKKRDAAAVGQGDLFVAAKAGPGQDGPMITDDSGHLIWFKKIGGKDSVFDFRRQTYRGHPVLTWWQGVAKSGQGLGAGHIVDTSYRSIATVQAGNGYKADLHEFEISRNDTALLLAYQPVTYDGETEMDTLMQEIDIPTGLVMFEWHSLGNIARSESYVKYSNGRPNDVAHLNSIQLTRDGNFLVSGRNNDAVYKINRATGKIIWRLGGKRSDFNLSKASHFVGQHHARLQPDGSITLFDNGQPPQPRRPARALWLNVDSSHRKVSVRHSYRYPKTLYSGSQGSMQVLGNARDVFVGWGGNHPQLTEFDYKGNVIFNARFKPGDDTYRAFRYPWDAQPDRAPDIAASRSGGNTNVWASWNGATGVAQWQVLAGSNPNALVPAATVSRTGFETHATVSGSPQYVAVRALGPHGEVLGTSPAIQPSG